MKATTGKEIKFFQILGKLFYSIAASDKKVHDSEVKVLKKIVRSKWIIENRNEDEYQTNPDYQIEFIFDWLVKNNMDPVECFKDFIFYKNKHEKEFTMEIRKLIWETANAIANAFAGKNKSEVILLAKLKLNLQNEMS
jgi:hypothetical protein